MQKASLVNHNIEPVFLNYLLEMLHLLVGGGHSLLYCVVANTEMLAHAKIMVGQQLHYSDRFSEGGTELGSAANILVIVIK